MTEATPKKTTQDEMNDIASQCALVYRDIGVAHCKIREANAEISDLEVKYHNFNKKWSDLRRDLEKEARVKAELTKPTLVKTEDPIPQEATTAEPSPVDGAAS